MTETFNLIDRPWLTCSIDGTTRNLSLREVFEQLPRIHRVSGDSPPQSYALLRLLEVIFWRAYRSDSRLTGTEKDLEGWWEDMFYASASDHPDDHQEMITPVLAYLEEHRERFDLLDPAAPFMQVADLHTSKDSRSPVRRIIPDAEIDYMTLRAGAGLDSLSYAEAARHLVALQSWDYSGIKSGAVGDPRVKGGKGYPIGTGWTGRTGGVVLHGQNLAQTLVLNTVPAAVFTDQMYADLPVWEQEPQGAAPRGTEFPAGPCDVLTWQSRRVRLFPENGVITSALVSNGDRIELKNQFADPMTGYRWSRNQSTKDRVVHMPGAHSPERTLWRGLQALLVREGVVSLKKGEHLALQPKTVEALRRHQLRGESEDLSRVRIGVELVGIIYGTNDSIIEDTIHEEIPLNLGILLDSSERSAALIIAAADATVQAAVALGQFAGKLEQASGGDYVFRTEAADGALQELGEQMRRWLEDLTPGSDAEAMKVRWFRDVESTLLFHAAELRRGAGRKAEIGRIKDDGELVTAAVAENIFRSRLRKILPHLREDSESQAVSDASTHGNHPDDPQQIGA